jgi:HEAT repeat protein
MRMSFMFVPLALSAIVFAQQPDGDRARTLLEESLKDKNPDTRKQAVQALGLVGPREPYVS